MSAPRALVSPEELAARLGEVTLLDVRWQLGRSDGHERYLAGHVPGAAYVDLERDLAAPAGDGSRGRHPLPDAEDFAAAVRRCGVREDRPVVVYDGGGATAATRAWWLLRHHGHPDVAVLDGGWAWWDRDGRPVETGEVRPEPGTFAAGAGRLPLLDADGAGRLARDGVLLDARAPERYRGETEPVDPVAGHVPGAVNVPTAANLEPAGSPREGRFRGRGHLAAVYAAAGATLPGTAVGAYCGSGVTATHDLFALHLLGVEGALYAGSWSEWVTDPDRPVETRGRSVASAG